TTALEELADLEELESTLGQEYAGANLDDIDEEAVRRALGRSADNLRRLRATALRRVFASLSSATRGDHDVPDAGSAGELTGASRPWQFGDEQPLDVVRTVQNAIRRGGTQTSGAMPNGVRLHVDDFEVVETE